jgi:hypothetical protein
MNSMMMTEATLQRRTTQLAKEIANHPHREELLDLIQEQLIDQAMDEYITIIN